MLFIVVDWALCHN